MICASTDRSAHRLRAGTLASVVAGILTAAPGFAQEPPATDEANLDYNAGIAHVAAGRWAEAAAAFSRALAGDADDVDALIQLGWAEIELERYADAAEIFTRALRLDDEDPDAHQGLTTALGDLGRIREMADASERWARATPGNADAHAALGIARLQLDDAAAAERAFREAVALAADDAAAHFNLGLAELALGRHAEAAEQFRRSIELEPESPGAYTNLGAAYLSLAQPAEAEIALEQALRLKPDSLEARFDLGLAHLAAGDRDGALEQVAALRGLDSMLADDLERRAAGEDTGPGAEARTAAAPATAAATSTAAASATAAANVSACCAMVPNPERRRLGRLVVAYPVRVPDARLDVFLPGAATSIASGYGDQAIDLLPGAYDVAVSGRRIAGVTIRSGQDTRIRVGVLQARAETATRVEVVDAATGQSIIGAYGDKRFGLPVGEFGLRVGSRTEAITITEGEIEER